MCYKIFLDVSLYDDYFRIKIIKLKLKTHKILRSSKHKKCVHKNILRATCKKGKNAHKNYQKLFEEIRKRGKRLHFSNFNFI